MHQLALQEARTVNFQFRQHYRLAPTDPRYLAMESWELEKEMLAVRYDQDMKSGRFIEEFIPDEEHREELEELMGSESEIVSRERLDFGEEEGSD